MKLRLSKVLFVTSFFPVVIFKALARVGEITPGRVKVAVATGLVLAGVQYLLSRRFLKYTTYLEKAFLGFLAAGPPIHPPFEARPGTSSCTWRTLSTPELPQTSRRRSSLIFRAREAGRSCSR